MAISRNGILRVFDSLVAQGVHKPKRRIRKALGMSGKAVTRIVREEKRKRRLLGAENYEAATDAQLRGL